MNEKEAQLEQAYSRLECGEAPDEESAKEWNKLLQMNQMAVVNRNMEVREVRGLERLLSTIIWSAISTV